MPKTQSLKYKKSEIFRFARENNLMLIILYGSRATGEAENDSDWDIAVVPKHGTYPKDILKLYSDISKLFEHEIDIGIITSRSDPLYRWEVFREGLALFEDKPGVFDNEYIAAWKVFLDTEHLRKLEKEIISEY